MRRFILLSIITLFTFFSIMHDVEARRFGGGRSFGMQRNVSSFVRQPSSYLSTHNQTNPGRSFGNKWLGPLAGLAAGGLLASLFMNHGIGSALVSWLGIGLLILFLISLFRRKIHPVTSYRQPNGNVFNGEFSRGPVADQAMGSFSQAGSFSQRSSINTQQQDYPAGFDADAFLRQAKLQFIRLQTAYDNKNLQDIREFTTPEVFAEIQLQIEERGHQNNQTFIVQLDAELLDISFEQPSFMRRANEERTLASVKFSGKLNEDQQEILLNETWHFVKEVNSSKWIVAGVQQVS